MNVRRLYAATTLVAAISALPSHVIAASPSVASPVLTTIFRFDGAKKGSLPQAGVTADPAGTGVLYGVTTGGGAYGSGIAFKLKPAAGKNLWPITILHDFKGNGSNADGRNPMAELLVSPGTGAIYGTTANGGPNDKGTVFQLLPPRSGQTAWRQSVLANFDNYQARGANPRSALIFGGKNSLLGTALLGGGKNDGTAFRLTQPSGKGWGFSLLHTFGATSNDGVQPAAGLVRDPSTNVLYGTTVTGGKHNSGTVYSLTQGGGQTTILYSFTGGNDGGAPTGNIIIGADGSLYGTASIGGAFNNGVVFQLKPVSGKWKFRVLHQFLGGSNDGAQPKGLAVGTGGVLYGATLYGGGSSICTGGCGTVFKMTPPSGGGQVWTETLLHRFGGRSDSSAPQGTLAVDTNDNDTLYGTTTGGNTGNDYGTVFRLRH